MQWYTLYCGVCICVPVLSFDKDRLFIPAGGAHPGPSFICKNLTDPRTNFEQTPRRGELSSDTSLMPLFSSEVQNLTYVVLPQFYSYHRARVQRCVKCNVASYCGKACQKKAWKDAGYLHKQVCSVLRKPTLCGGGEELVFRRTSVQDPVWFPPELQKELHSNWERAGVSADDLAYLVLWGTQLMSESGTIFKKLEPGPGFKDYNALAREMAGSSAGREGRVCHS